MISFNDPLTRSMLVHTAMRCGAVPESPGATAHLTNEQLIKLIAHMEEPAVTPPLPRSSWYPRFQPVDADDPHSQRVRAGDLLNLAEELLTAKPAFELTYEEREKAYYLTVVADTRINLARALDGRAT